MPLFSHNKDGTKNTQRKAASKAQQASEPIKLENNAEVPTDHHHMPARGHLKGDHHMIKGKKLINKLG